MNVHVVNTSFFCTLMFVT